MSQPQRHIPVMLNESIDAMNIVSNGSYIDATFGFGGHSEQILRNLDKDGKLNAIDKDQDAIDRLNPEIFTDERFSLKHGCFSDLSKFSKEWGVYGSVNGILFDLGVSSHHLDEPDRGFSFNKKGIVDMRFDQTSGISACDWIKGVDEQTQIGRAHV